MTTEDQLVPLASEALLMNIKNTLREDEPLTDIRGSLLPKLLSGEITLGNAQSAAEAVA